MSPKPDNRSDNVEKLQEDIDNTVRNIRRTNDMIELAPDEKTKQELTDKNERREDALNAFRHEIKDEADAREKS